MKIAADLLIDARNLTVCYGQHTVLKNANARIKQGSFTVIIGANGCGKSTLLRTIANLIAPRQGEVHLEGQPVRSYRPKELARRLAFLPQQTTIPAGISITDLISRGRYPHQSVLRRWSEEDEQAVRGALAATGLTQLSMRPADQLSGGQRQRALLAMVLAQETPLLLLDEPTTFLDITHQYETLELAAQLNRDGHTLIAVLHDLNQAARYATDLVVMSGGKVFAQGPPEQVLTVETVEQVFGLRCRLLEDPESGTPLVIPLIGKRS